MRTRRLTLAAAAFVAGGALSAPLAAATPTTASAGAVHHAVALHATATSAPSDPATNVPPTPNYWSTCEVSGPSSAACIDTEVAAIDNARALEGVGPMVLPAGFAQMPQAEQTFVVSNLERVDRGLAPAAGMVDTLNAASTTAAANDADPTLASWTVGPFSANRWGSIWAGDLNALAADYDWMYNDGWGPSGSYNLDCTSATASGCWGHRDNIISPYGGEKLITGVGSAAQSQWTSIAQIFVAGVGSYPPFTVAWSDIAGSAPTPVATGNAVTPGVVTTAASVSAPATVVAGHTATVTGRLADATTGAGVPAATVSLCHRVAAVPSCASGSTDATGRAVWSVRPTSTTSYWLSYGGSLAFSSAASALATVRVRPAVQLQRTRTSTGWRVSTHVTPARGQLVRLQRATARGWVTVVTRKAASSFGFGRLRSGTYRVVVAGTTGLLGNSARIRCA